MSNSFRRFLWEQLHDLIIRAEYEKLCQEDGESFEAKLLDLEAEFGPIDLQNQEGNQA